MEQEEYTKEEINWSYIEFIDNQDVLDLIEKVAFLALNIYISRTLWYGYAKTNLDENKIALSLSLSLMNLCGLVQNLPCIILPNIIVDATDLASSKQM